jgi:6-phosphogluconate dehydrogenase (decarboxylating)
MELGIIGLATNMVRRLQRAGCHCVVCDAEEKAAAKTEAA